jgi:hypothetical protein
VWRTSPARPHAGPPSGARSAIAARTRRSLHHVGKGAHGCCPPGAHIGTHIGERPGTQVSARAAKSPPHPGG